MNRESNQHITVTLHDVSIGYNKRGKTDIVAAGLAGELYEGELVCILGANGAGKSTLLRTIASFQPVLGGEIKLLDKPLNMYKPSDLSMKVGVVLTHNSMNERLTVHDVVGMGRTPYTGFWGRLSSEDETIVAESLAMVGIGALAHRYIDSLSDGERQKTMIAKALAQQTPIILLDEPTSYLDFPSKIETMMLLNRLAHEYGKSILLSTHDVELALQTADILWMIDKSHGLIVGTPNELSADGTIERFFQRDGIAFDAVHKRFLINR